MQFLWKYIDDLVGKGLSVGVLGELFFYAAVSMVPMALPLAILLASLMTFGNLGEKFELTAMKASGISLIRVMVPLIVTVGMIAVGAFFLSERHIAQGSGEDVDTALLNASEVARTGDTRRGFLRPDTGFQPVCQGEEPHQRDAARRDDL